MERLTSIKDISKMGMFELAHNSCYVENGKAKYRDYNLDIDARELTRQLLKDLADEDDAFIDDENFDGYMQDCLSIEMNDIEGLIAVFYRNMWAMAELHETLKYYEDLEEEGLLLKLPCKVGDTIFVIPSKTNYELNIINGYAENNKVYCQQVDSVQIFSGGYTLKTRDGLCGTLSDFYKKTWFLTQAEAEEALEKMGRG